MYTGRGRVILANAFSPSMLVFQGREGVYVEFRRIDLLRLIALTPRADDCAIGHPGTVELLDQLTNQLRNVACKRKEIKLRPGDTLVIITLSFRPEEGKIYDYKELEQLYNEGKIVFYEARVLEMLPTEKVRIVVAG